MECVIIHKKINNTVSVQLEFRIGNQLFVVLEDVLLVGVCWGLAAASSRANAFFSLYSRALSNAFQTSATDRS
jgi:hypothetical protein